MDWDPDQLLEDMVFETSLDTDAGDKVDYKATAERLMVEHAPYAAQVLRHLALYSTNEQTRLRAAESILNRVLGRPGNEPMVTEDTDPLRILTGTFIEELEEHANTGTAGNVRGEFD